MKVANRRIRKEAKRLGFKSNVVPLASVSPKLFWLICTRNERKADRKESS